MTVRREGQFYGAWEALAPTGATDPTHGWFWRCRATCCGRERVFSGSHLRDLERAGCRRCRACSTLPASPVDRVATAKKEE